MPWSLLTNKWLLGGLVIAGLGVAIWIQTERLDAAQKAREAAELVAGQWKSNAEAIAVVNAANVKALADMKADQARINAAADAARVAVADLQSRYETLRRSTRNVAAQNDGPIAPVLATVLDGLRRIEADSAGAAGGGAD